MLYTAEQQIEVVFACASLYVYLSLSFILLFVCCCDTSLLAFYFRRLATAKKQPQSMLDLAAMLPSVLDPPPASQFGFDVISQSLPFVDYMKQQDPVKSDVYIDACDFDDETITMYGHDSDLNGLLEND